MNAEALLRKHLKAAAAGVEVTPMRADVIVGRVRWMRTLIGIAAAAGLVAVVAVVGLANRGSDDLIGPVTTITPTTTPSVVATTTTTSVASEVSTTTTAAPATTTSQPPGEPEVAWTEADAERDVENYLAALAAGAYAQAAWPLENNGVAFEGQSAQETPASYLSRVCAGGACLGPYEVAADGPGLINESSQASSTVTVTHTGSGDTSVFTVATFEGQRMVLGVPPLVPSAGGTSLVEELFGDDIPDRVVIERFDAFEIWDDDVVEWVTNWWAEEIRSIEGDYAAGWTTGVIGLHDPALVVDVICAELMTRGDTVLVFDRCGEDGWVYIDVRTGTPVDTPIEDQALEDGESVGFMERGDTTLTNVGDAEGNLTRLEADGVDLTGDDYIGVLALSVDGSRVAYVDHRDPDAYSHFWSPVVVVKDAATGIEINRWVLDGPVLGLQFSGDWVVAWEASSDAAELASGDPAQAAVVAINVDTGTVNRVETATKVFLPS